MNIRKFNAVFRDAVVLVLVFLLASQPALVAASPAFRDPNAEAINLMLEGGEAYLDSMSVAVLDSAELYTRINAIQATPLSQLNDAYIANTITQALSIAEDVSVALGASNSLADGIEQLSVEFPTAIDVAQTASEGLPEQMQTDLMTHAGLSTTETDEISAAVSDLYTARQAASTELPADVQTSLLGFGFTQTQIDEIEVAVGERGLVDTSLDTRIRQFRAAQDELADVRGGMLVLAVQLLGHRIAIQQANGVVSRPATDEELQELVDDELRLLVHVAHLNAAWGNDPGADVGEGDWWFIEHYAGRVADRLQSLIVETQNRGLVADLFVVHQMRMLAISARSGDAAYAKAELDSLAELLSYRLNATDYYQERSSANLLERTLAKLSVKPEIREHVEWPVAGGVAKDALVVTQEHLQAHGVQDLSSIVGNFDELDESNNQMGILLVAGLPFWDQVDLAVTQAGTKIVASVTPQNLSLWYQAILSGNTDNPALLTANMALSLVPVLGALPDIISLVEDPSIFIKALSIFGIIGSIGDVIAIVPGLQGVAGASFFTDATATVTKTLFRQADNVFKAVLNGLKLADAFDVVLDVVKTTLRIVGDSLGHGLDEVITTLRNLFTGSTNLWGNFVSFTRRVGADLLLKLGFDEGSMLVGRVLHYGFSLSDEAIIALKSVSDDLLVSGVDMTDEAVKGLGEFADSLGEDNFKRFMDGALKTCDISSASNGLKLAKSINTMPRGACSPKFVKDLLTSYGMLDAKTLEAAKRFGQKIEPDDLLALMRKYGSDPASQDQIKHIFTVLGNPKVSKDAINIAMDQGEEATYAFSLWNKSYLEDSNIAEELAERAGKDAKVLEDIGNLIALKPIDPKNLTDAQKEIINRLAKNSSHGSGSSFVLGAWDENLEYLGGYVKYARETGGQYYHSHEKVYDFLGAFGSDRSEIAWLINKEAISGPIKSGLPFEYTMEGITNVTAEKAAIEAIWNGKSDDFIIDLLPGTNKMPGRMKELKELYLAGYEKITDDLGDFLFYVE